MRLVSEKRGQIEKQFDVPFRNDLKALSVVIIPRVLQFGIRLPHKVRADLLFQTRSHSDQRSDPVRLLGLRGRYAPLVPRDKGVVLSPGYLRPGANTSHHPNAQKQRDEALDQRTQSRGRALAWCETEQKTPTVHSERLYTNMHHCYPFLPA